MKILDRLYNWLSDISPKQSMWDSIKKYKENKVADKLFDSSNPDFMSWAFGENYEALSLDQKMLAWNGKHGDKLPIDQIDHMYDKRTHMGELWVQSLQVRK